MIIVPECRICFDNDEKLISPCKCTGTAAYVHENCLQKWRTECKNNPDKYNKCDLCKENYSIHRSKPKEYCFITFFNNNSQSLHWFPLSFIWFSSLVIGTIDVYTNRTSIEIIHLVSLEDELKVALKSNALCIFGYYQSLGMFVYSSLMLFFIKTSTMCLIHQRFKYYTYMLLYDLFYMSSIMIYPFIFYITYCLQVIEWLCILGTLGIFFTIPINVIYFKKHNAVLNYINVHYRNERIINRVETQTLSP